ncbi:hypothetical protein S144_70 [Shewanella sp. phage 1/44]|uniref:hypothetical protein n=1 Tax=Shewanella sp. phage 1/44 TaxID=1458862 RepID=UPI0004F80835|nr:hypothetical protein S144_70 [Shewanella sp. phage 1/44]AHK11784.1 hypothetical protein S144_70 [Shewanella sp. phage 1/44]
MMITQTLTETISLPVKHVGLGSIVDAYGDEFMVVSVGVNPDTIVKVLNDFIAPNIELAYAMHEAIQAKWYHTQSSYQPIHDYLFPSVIAVDGESCDGCLYRDVKGECKPCMPDERDDGRDVIYVKGGV